METILETIVTLALYLLYIVLIPVVFALATPSILLWPGRRQSDGSRAKRDLRGRYGRMWKVLESTGLGLPTR